MLSDDAKKTIDALPTDELQQEIDKGRRSRFQGDKFAYLSTRLAAIKQHEQSEVRQEDMAHKLEELSLAREANQLSLKANKLSKVAIAVSILAAITALGTLIIDPKNRSYLIPLA